MNTSSSLNKPVLVAVMGATGAGKSTFVRQLTGDSKIRIGHDQQSETFDIQTAYYIDRNSGRPVVLIDTPGFDDSREGITDTDILEKIVRWLEPGSGKARKLNGIIYVHRISDPRVGGVSRKNLRMFRSLCGADQLGNVRIVTTNWDRVTEEEGNHREADLKEGAFKALLDCGAKMCRHANNVESARMIMSELIPLQPVTIQVQDELHEGKKLSETAAGMELNRDMQELRKRHQEEMRLLKKELEAGARARDRALRAELERERRALEEKVARIEADWRRMERTLVYLCHSDVTLESESLEELQVNILISETTTIQEDVEESLARYASLEMLLTMLEYESITLLSEDATPALDALLSLVRCIESLYQATRAQEMSAWMAYRDPTSALVEIQAYAPFLNACKSQSRLVFAHFQSLNEKARDLTQRFTELTRDFTFEVSATQEYTEKLQNMMGLAAALRLGAENQRLQQINNQVELLDTLRAMAFAQDFTLQASVPHSQDIRMRTLDLTHASLDVSLFVGTLAAKSEPLAVHHTAQELARIVLSFGSLVVSEERFNELFLRHDPEVLQDALDMIAWSDGDDVAENADCVITQEQLLAMDDLM